MKIADSNIEIKVLKSILNDEKLGAVILSRINDTYFGTEDCKALWDRIGVYVRLGKPIPNLEIIKMDASLSDSTKALVESNTTPLKSEIEFDEAFVVLDKFRKARIIYDVLNRSVAEMQLDNPDVDAVLRHMQGGSEQCNSSTSETEMFHYESSNLDKLLEEIEDDLSTPDPDFIETGFSEFDKRSGGFRKKNIITIASVPGGGKSAMALQMAANQYLMGHRVCIVSMEMDEIEIKHRLLSSVSRIDHASIQLKRLSQVQRAKIRERFSEFIKDSPGLLTIITPKSEVDITKIKLMIKPYKYDIVYVDYIGLLAQDPKKAMHEVLGDHARAAKLAANETNSVWCLLAQYDDKEQKIKYSKAIVANSNFVWSWDNSKTEQEMGIIEVKQLKARNSEAYPFYLHRDMSVMQFSDHIGPPPVLAEKKESKDEKPYLPSMPELN